MAILGDNNAKSIKPYCEGFRKRAFFSFQILNVIYRGIAME